MTEQTIPLNKKGLPRQRKEKVSVDIKELEKVAKLNCTTKEMAIFFGCSRELLDQPRYAAIIQKSREDVKQRLKQKAVQRALVDDSDTMLIFCLKNYCGWSNNDKTQIELTNNTQLSLADMYKQMGSKIDEE